MLAAHALDLFSGRFGPAAQDSSRIQECPQPSMFTCSAFGFRI